MATLDHILHMLRIPGLTGFVMFPAGVFFMLKAYKASNNLSVIFSTSVVAATIKLSNILLYPIIKNMDLKTHSIPKPTFSPSVLASCLLFIAAMIAEWML